MSILPSVLRRRWLGGRKGIRPVKNWVVGCWHGYLSGARCRLAYGPADATATHCLLLQIGFTFLVPAHPGSPGKGPLNRCMYVYCVCVRVCVVVFSVSEASGKDCAICMDRQRDCLLCPCHHLVTCNDCAQSLISRRDGCPICRKDITEIIHVYHS